MSEKTNRSPATARPETPRDRGDECSCAPCQQEEAVKPKVLRTTSNFREPPWAR